MFFTPCVSDSYNSKPFFASNWREEDLKKFPLCGKPKGKIFLGWVPSIQEKVGIKELLKFLDFPT